jgi:hypothetical protein
MKVSSTILIFLSMVPFSFGECGTDAKVDVKADDKVDVGGGGGGGFNQPISTWGGGGGGGGFNQPISTWGDTSPADHPCLPVADPAPPSVNPNAISNEVAGTITPNALQGLLALNQGLGNLVSTGAIGFGALSPASAIEAGQFAQSTVASSRPGVNNPNANLIDIPGSFLSFAPTIDPIDPFVFPTIPAP